MNVGIVGAGFWAGAVQATLARKAQTVVLDPGDNKAGSGAAQGLVKLDWLRSATLEHILPEWWGRAHDEASEAHLVRLGAEETTELVTTWARPDPVRRGGLLLVDPVAARASVDYRVRVLRVEQLGNHVLLRLEDDDTMMFDKVVICAGVWTDDLLKRSGYPGLGVSSIAGSTVIGRMPDPPRKVVWTHQTAPYRHVSVRPWKQDLVQVGASMAKGTEDQAQFEGMMKHVKERWPDFTPDVRLSGLRPVGPAGQAVAKLIDRGIIVATGGNRIGLVLAGGIARKVEELL